MSGNASLDSAERAFTDELFKANARFIIVGGYAAAAYFSRGPRDDLDVLMDPSDQVTRRAVVNAVRYHCREYSWHLSDEALSTPGIHEPTMLKAGGCVDVLTSVSGVDFTTAWEWRCYWRDQNVELPILCREHLIESKKTTRPRDLADRASLAGLPLLYSVPSTLLAKMGILTAQPSTTSYCTDDPVAVNVPLAELIPPRLGPHRRGLSEERLREVLSGIGRGDSIPAVVAYREPDAMQAVLLNGAHRYFASRAAGFSSLPVVYASQEVAEYLYGYPFGQQ